eukprot:Protomagalhaensia_wolfi_Nauph_80__4979@NODE_525_length_2379_cov_81_206838_g391_i0_p1_GENE_NODE_525_length_2379_cov_81_206838_g391_i0NODE_525_length_2379_cov_81_206838_g391_i0_p1_ORF_typecomplete_len341_score94_06NAP/PF00956_18/3_3e55_NODE_525_length_2379_cov_81_206838_g391_i012662288
MKEATPVVPTETNTAAVTVHHREKFDVAVAQTQEKFMLPPPAVETLQRLVNLHIEQLKVEANYRAEWLALKAKYYRLLDQKYAQRSNILTKSVKDLADETEATTSAASAVLDAGAAPADIAAAIPDFWLTVLQNHPAVGNMVEARDREILKYVNDISYSWGNPDEQLDFTIVFKFAPNPYFNNKELTKTFNLEIDSETQDPILNRSVGTKIDWKAGKDITTKTVTKKQKNKRTGETRIVKEHVDKLSFFHFFDSHDVPDEDILETMDDDDIDALENLLDTEYEVGCILRDKIIAHAVGWYLGVEVDDEEESSIDSNFDSEEEGAGDDSEQELGSGPEQED